VVFGTGNIGGNQEIGRFFEPTGLGCEMRGVIFVALVMFFVREKF
jgi:hypothetical protein